MNHDKWEIFNPSGKRRVIVTRKLPGKRWLEILKQADCRVGINAAHGALSIADIKAAMGSQCHGAIGQLSEKWDDELFSALQTAGGQAFSNYAVGYDNVDVAAATKHGIPVGNTPGVLTETTAQMAVALTFAAARRIVEADRFLRAGRFQMWLPDLFLGQLLWHRTLGVIGAGRIGSTYARMMVEGHKMNLIYFNLTENKALEDDIAAYGAFLKGRGQPPVSCKRADRIEDVLAAADCVSLHTVLDKSTRHLINAERLALMKDTAILVNTSRGAVIDEAALVTHCREHPDFRAGLDVFEDEPQMKPGLAELENVVVVPHIASATSWTRQGMATLAAANVAAILMGYPAWNKPDISSFLEDDLPEAAPSIVNAADLGMETV